MKQSSQNRLSHWINVGTYTLVALTLILLMTGAQAAELGLVGGLGIHSTHFDPAISGNTEKSKSSVVYGATLGFHLSPGWMFETGALYGTHEGRLEVDAQNYVDFKQKNLNIPILIRHHFGPVVSVGAGGYYSLGFGNSTSTTTAAGVTGAETDSGSKVPDDYGWVASLRAEVPLGTKMKFAVEGRYQAGLKSVDLGGSPGKFTDLYALAGIVFSL